MKYDPEMGQIQQIYQQPTGATDSIALAVVRTETQNTVKMSKIANTKRTKKWWRLSTQFRGNKSSGDMRQPGTQLI